MSPGVEAGVLIVLLIAANVGHIPLLKRFTTPGANQSAFQLCAINESISSFDECDLLVLNCDKIG